MRGFDLVVPESTWPGETGELGCSNTMGHERHSRPIRLLDPRLLAPVAKPLFPPGNGGSPLHLAFLPNEPEIDIADVVRRNCRSSRYSSSRPAAPASAVWEIPTMIPAVFFTLHVTLLFGPPRVPRSVSALFRHRIACRFLFSSLE